MRNPESAFLSHSSNNRLSKILFSVFVRTRKTISTLNFYLYFLFLTNIKVTVLLSVRFQDYDKFKKPKEMPDRPGKIRNRSTLRIPAGCANRLVCEITRWTNEGGIVMEILNYTSFFDRVAICLFSVSIFISVS